MPRPSKKKLKRQMHASYLRSQKKRNNNILTDDTPGNEPSALPLDVTIDERKENESFRLTSEKRKHHSTLQREINALNTTAVQVRDSRARDSGNRIIHWDSLKSIIDNNLCCKFCGDNVCLSNSSTGIATEVQISCKSCDMKKK